MRAKTYHITSLSAIQEATKFIIGIIPDGKLKVVISNAGSKTEKQNNLWWMWCTDVSKSGIGGEHEDHPDGVHLVAKYKIVHPILQRVSADYAGLYAAYYEKYEFDRKKMEFFFRHHVSTTDLDKKYMAEALTNFKNFYGIKHGVNLRDPEFRGLLDG